MNSLKMVMPLNNFLYIKRLNEAVENSGNELLVKVVHSFIKALCNENQKIVILSLMKNIKIKIQVLFMMKCMI